MFDNIQHMGGSDWVCWLDEPFDDNNIVYAGDGMHSVTGSDMYW